MKRNQYSTDMYLAIAFMRVRFNVDMVVVNRKNSARNRVMTTHTVPDLNLLAVFYEPLQSGPEAHS